MEDIRKNKIVDKRKKYLFYNKIKFFFLKNIYKFILILLLSFIIIYPDIFGELLGYWWNEFASSFIEKLNY